MSFSHFSPYQFVTLRTFGRAPLLAKDAMKQRLLDCFMETKKHFSLTIAGYVVLSDHAHFLFKIPGDYESSAIMNDLRTNRRRFLNGMRPTTPHSGKLASNTGVRIRPTTCAATSISSTTTRCGTAWPRAPPITPGRACQRASHKGITRNPGPRSARQLVSLVWHANARQPLDFDCR